MNWDQMQHHHKWALYNVAFLGRRWQCHCGVTAPKCFVPKPEDILTVGP